MLRFQTLLKEIKDAAHSCNIPIKEGLMLPTTSVVGSQSSGKSSTLGSLIQLDILPRGVGVVTKRPLEMRYHRAKEAYVSFEEISPKKIYSIGAETDAIKAMVTKLNEGPFSDKPIVLDVYQPNIDSLCFVDLPGVFLWDDNVNTTFGDDDSDRVEEMILKYIGPKQDALILAIVNGSEDLANSGAMKLIRKADKTYERTIVVLTMVDIAIEKKPETLKKNIEILNRILKKGWYAVKNRSQQDNCSLADGIALEDAFFAKHASFFADLQKEGNQVDNLGSRQLGLRIQREFEQRILMHLPRVIAALEQLQVDVSTSLDSLKSRTLKDLLAQFHAAFKAKAMLPEATSKRFKNKNVGFTVTTPEQWMNMAIAVPPTPTFTFGTTILYPVEASTAVDQVFQFLLNKANDAAEQLFVEVRVSGVLLKRRFPKAQADISKYCTVALQQYKNSVLEEIRHTIEKETRWRQGSTQILWEGVRSAVFKDIYYFISKFAQDFQQLVNDPSLIKSRFGRRADTVEQEGEDSNKIRGNLEKLNDKIAQFIRDANNALSASSSDKASIN